MGKLFEDVYISISGDPVHASIKELDRYSSYLVSTLKMKQFEEISIRFCSGEEIRDLNSKYRDLDKPTDILSFHLPGPCNDQDLGDLYLCVEEFEDQFKLGDARKLLFFLVSHGFLHLLGWTHETPEKFDEMMLRQESLVDGFLKNQDISKVEGHGN